MGARLLSTLVALREDATFDRSPAENHGFFHILCRENPFSALLQAGPAVLSGGGRIAAKLTGDTTLYCSGETEVSVLHR